MRKLLLGLAIGICTFAMSIVASAGQWHLDNTGWWYQDAHNSYLTDGWHWINGKCYYFTKEGYCLMNTTTPDGYIVDESGAWIVNGTIQEMLSQSEIRALVGRANQAYNNGVNSSYLSDGNVVCIRENFELKLIGDVVQYDTNTNTYVPIKTFIAYFESSAGSELAGYAFNQLVVE